MSGILRCPKCGHEIDREHPVCEGCGAKLKIKALKLPEPRVVKVSKTMADAIGAGTGDCGAAGAKFCTQCGRQLEAWQKFCPGCGTAVGGDSPGGRRSEWREDADRRMNGCAMASGGNITINAQTLIMSVAIAGACVCAIMWIAGCADAASCVEEGMNYFRYRAKMNSMNVISRSGFSFYMDNFTDAREKQKEVDDSMEKLREIFDF